MMSLTHPPPPPPPPPPLHELAASHHPPLHLHQPLTQKPHTLSPPYQSDPTIPSQDSNQFNLDQFLSAAELLCIFSSSIITISYALNYTIWNSKRGVFGVIGSNTGFAWGMVVMVSGMVIGAWIRRRQWWRVSRETGREGSRESLNLVGRIEKLEEDLRSSATIIRVLSRKLEKLGIRFRVTRKALKEPIAETAALAQKNSDATRALAVQEDILEKELGEIQKVLLAMQEQQQKQLELILAIAKSGKLWDNRRQPVQEQELTKTSDLTEGLNQLQSP
ncbi:TRANSMEMBRANE PROTEIN [Salix purpurea]|uniref:TRANSMEMBRANE PROTEIN n=1 Tax=Salix purpurea TaxID=77065 RepID=A0A9Q0V2Q8_SALPP|nr:TRANSMEMBRANE PROTEIN [Salix purpurea]